MLNIDLHPWPNQEALQYQEVSPQELSIPIELVYGQSQDLLLTEERLALLNWTSQIINSASLNPPALYQAVQQIISLILPVDVCILSMINESDNQLTEITFTNGNNKYTVNRIPFTGTFLEYVLRCNATVNVPDFSLGIHKEFGIGNFGFEGMGSGLAVILEKGGTPLGVLAVQSVQAHAYTHFDKLFLEAFAAHVSVALENAKLHERMQKAVVTAERQRLARDLHDTVTQLLYSMTLMSSGWKNICADQHLDDLTSSFAQLEEIGLRALKRDAVIDPPAQTADPGEARPGQGTPESPGGGRA